MVGEERLSVDDPLCRGKSIRKAHPHNRRPLCSQHDLGEVFKSMDHSPTVLLLLAPLVGRRSQAQSVGEPAWKPSRLLQPRRLMPHTRRGGLDLLTPSFRFVSLKTRRVTADREDEKSPAIFLTSNPERSSDG